MRSCYHHSFGELIALKLRVKQQMLINAVCSTRPGGVLELSTFNYFFAGAFFAGVVFCSS